MEIQRYLRLLSVVVQLEESEESTHPEEMDSGANTCVRWDGLVVSTTKSFALVRFDPACDKRSLVTHPQIITL